MAVTWYHTIDLPDGTATPGEVDLRPVLDRVPLPASLAGRRCLDVGTHDGFWAFEMERRGADEVLAIDLDDPARLDWPQGMPSLSRADLDGIAERKRCFEVAREALGSSVERRFVSVYDLDPSDVGEFDFVTIGTLLLHLRDPVAALRAIGGVLRGELLVHEAVSLSLSVLRPNTPAAKLHTLDERPFWWLPNVAGLRRYATMAGLEVVDSGGPYLLPNGAGAQRLPLRLRPSSGPRLPRQLLLRRGLPHGWVLARRWSG